LISNFKFQISNSEKGVSLIITFFVLVIILAVVLSISIILYSEIKIIRNIGDSVVAFYAADSGVEKTLYYDRYGAPEGATGGKRGVCVICDYEICSQPPISLSEDVSVDGCDPMACENCEVSFSTTLSDSPKKTYSVTAVVKQETSPDNPSIKFSYLSIYSTGSYASATGANEVKRAIQLDTQKDETGSLAPEINNAFVSFKTQPEGDLIIISADINAHGHGVKSVKAHIYSNNGYNNTVPLSSVNGPNAEGNYTVTVSGLVAGIYSADITACDNKTPSNCYTQYNVPGI